VWLSGTVCTLTIKVLLWHLKLDSQYFLPRQLFEKKMQLFGLKFRHGVENVLIFHFHCR